MESEYLLSIVIPTKNRENYALATIQQILSLNDHRIQVVIQDNSDEETLRESIIKFNNKSLKYNYSNTTLSFVDNFNMAIDLADGEYICIIGDDDGILPLITEVVVWAKTNMVDAIKPGLNAVYYWPNSMAIKEKNDNGYLTINPFTKKVNLRNPQIEVEKLLKQGASDYLKLNLVKLYHGIVRKECLEEIKKETGKYFGGLSPDIYISVALSLNIKKVVEIGFPLTISGICNKSGSSDSATGKHTGELESAPHLKGHKNYVWTKDIPKFYSVDTIWADSALAALKDLEETTLLMKFNLEFLTIKCLLKYPQYKKVILKNYLNNSKSSNYVKMKNTIYFLVYISRNLMKKMFRKIIPNNKPNSNYYMNNVTDIISASAVIQKKLALNNINVLKVKTLLDEGLKKK